MNKGERLKFIVLPEILFLLKKKTGHSVRQLTSFEDDRSACASIWLLLISDFIFLVEATTDIGTDTNLRSWMMENGIKKMRNCYMSQNYYHSLQDLYWCVLLMTHLLTDSCHWTGTPPALHKTVLGLIDSFGATLLIHISISWFVESKDLKLIRMKFNNIFIGFVI